MKCIERATRNSALDFLVNWSAFRSLRNYCIFNLLNAQHLWLRIRHMPCFDKIQSCKNDRKKSVLIAQWCVYFSIFQLPTNSTFQGFIRWKKSGSVKWSLTMTCRAILVQGEEEEKELPQRSCKTGATTSGWLQRNEEGHCTLTHFPENDAEVCETRLLLILEGYWIHSLPQCQMFPFEITVSPDARPKPRIIIKENFLGVSD